MSKTNTQCNRLLEYLRTHKGGISSGEAYSKLHIYRVAARIKDLRDEGHDIVTDRESSINSEGDVSRYAVYRLRT